MNQKTYVIGGKTYRQNTLVLGQLRQLLDLLKETTFPEEITPMGIINALGDDKLQLALAIVLTEEGKDIKDKDIAAIADDLEFAATLEQVIEVVDDFFGCNPIPLLLTRIAGMTKQLKMSTTGLETSASPLAEEILQGVMLSSGDTPLENANPG
jgi:hypothetical protein